MLDSCSYTRSEEGAKMEQKTVATMKTYELCNLLLVLLDTNVGTMTDCEYRQHEEARAAIKKELKKRLTLIANTGI